MIHTINSNTTLTNVEADDIQPNAIDLKLDKVFRIGVEEFTIDAANNKTHRSNTEIIPDNDGFWHLPVGAYQIIMQNIIKVGADEAGWVITRSTLNRNGCFITSGLYDSGYNGVMAGVLHVTCGPLKIQKGARVGQYLNFKAEALKQYNGSYGLNSKYDTNTYN